MKLLLVFLLLSTQLITVTRRTENDPDTTIVLSVNENDVVVLVQDKTTALKGVVSVTAPGTPSMPLKMRVK